MPNILATQGEKAICGNERKRQMKKYILLILAITLLAVLTSCDYLTAGNSGTESNNLTDETAMTDEEQETAPAEVEPEQESASPESDSEQEQFENPQDDTELATESASTPSEPTETTAENIKAQMAGFWRMDWPNPANAVIMILSEDGMWESPGPLPTDNTHGGSFFVITSEDAGIYNLILTLEHDTWPYAEIGLIIDIYYFDAQNDQLFQVVSGEGGQPMTILFFRE